MNRGLNFVSSDFLENNLVGTARVISAVSSISTKWWARHLVVISLSVLGTYLFLESRVQWSDMHRWNRAIGDVSLVLVAAVMAIGPLARLWPQCNLLIPWRREGGIYAVILAAIHGVIILMGWVELDFLRLFGYEIHPATGQYVMTQHGFALANILGLVALVYGAALAASSNDLSVRLFGPPVWKFIQQGSYVLWMLVLLHTAYFIYLHFLHFHRPLPEPNWVQWPFALLVLFIAALQLSAFVKTWRMRRRGGKIDYSAEASMIGQ